MVAKNRREKEEEKDETSKNTAARKACLQQNWSEAFHKFQYFMDNLL